MISLDLDLSYLSRYYHIDTKAWQQYRNMSIPEIMQTEAMKGNQQAAEFLMRITTNPEELAKVYQLIEPKNRFMIIANMNHDDQMKIMEFLEPEEMVLGLSIFTKDALVELMQQLPPETLSKLVQKTMEPEKFSKSLKEEHMDEFFESDKLDRNMFMKSLENVEEVEMQKMMENVTGQPCYESKDDILKKMEDMNDNQFQRSLMSFEKEGKQQIVTGLISEKPDLLEEFSPEALVQPFAEMEKEDILKSLTVLETEELLPMVEDLPQDITALIATQIDPVKFSEILCEDFKDIIASCGVNV